MVPDSWLSILLFVLLIAPGLLFEQLSERRRAGVSESAFREISRVVLASLVFSGFAFAILALVRTIRPVWMPDPGMLFRDAGTYVAGQYRLVLRALVAEGAIALGVVALIHRLLARKQGSSVRSVSSWRQVFRRDCPRGCAVFVRVRLTSGLVYAGALAAYTADPDDAEGELVLAPPIFTRQGSGAMSAVPPSYQRVVIPRNAIEVLSVEYRPVAVAAPTPVGPTPSSAPTPNPAPGSGPAPSSGPASGPAPVPSTP